MPFLLFTFVFISADLLTAAVNSLYILRLTFNGLGTSWFYMKGYFGNSLHIIVDCCPVFLHPFGPVQHQFSVTLSTLLLDKIS